MNMIAGAFRKYLRKHRHKAFDAVAARILQTKPLQMDDSGLMFASMCSHADVTRYLLALKSIYRFVGTGTALVINDGSLTEEDKQTILRHVPLCGFVDIGAVERGPCPKGGAWERLLQIVDLTRDHYVIQIDSDTLTRGPVDELVSAWRENRSWLLGTNAGETVDSAADVAKMVRGWPPNPRSIVMLAEMALGDIPELAATRYCHASAGFAGFARGAFTREAVYGFSQAMQAHIGPRWTDWGTEQVTSNWVIANAPNPLVLPFARYACFEPWVDPATRTFLHFIGTYRYDGNVYRKMAEEVLAAM